MKAAAVAAVIRRAVLRRVCLEVEEVADVGVSGMAVVVMPPVLGATPPFVVSGSAYYADLISRQSFTRPAATRAPLGGETMTSNRRLTSPRVYKKGLGIPVLGTRLCMCAARDFALLQLSDQASDELLEFGQPLLEQLDPNIDPLLR